MSDIVERLRNWRSVHLTQLRYVMESAADEIERLRLSANGDCPKPENSANEDNESVRKTGGDFGQQPTLTNEEREVLLAIAADASYRAMQRTERVVRELLERLG
jgi:hypothetical protein